MSTFYEENLIIYGMSFNSFIPYSVKDDILSKIRKNFFEHNKRQSDKIVQNFNDFTIKYTYNLEKNKPMKWVVQKNKKTIEESVISPGSPPRVYPETLQISPPPSFLQEKL